MAYYEATAYKFSSPEISKLAGLKHGIYNPKLPTLRRMDRDDVTHKLSGEHSRTTTPCSKTDFRIARHSLVVDGGINVFSKNVMSKETAEALKSAKIKKPSLIHTDNWNSIMAVINKHYAQKKIDDAKDYHFKGLAIRRKQPSITSSWKHYEPVSSVGKSEWTNRPVTPKPMPATLYSRYRGSLNRPFCNDPWK